MARFGARPLCVTLWTGTKARAYGSVRHADKRYAPDHIGQRDVWSHSVDAKWEDKAGKADGQPGGLIRRTPVTAQA